MGLGTSAILWILLVLTFAGNGRAENWPRWRGPRGNAVSQETGLPTQWDKAKNVVWKTTVPGEGASSPIVWEDYVFVTSSHDYGVRRQLHCLDRRTGHLRWTREIADENPELSSSLTGYAAPTPVTDGSRVVAFLGNGGLLGRPKVMPAIWAL